MASIVLLTFNARYHHASFALRYLKANLGDLEPQCAILEFDLEKRPADAMEQVLALSPSIVGVSVYIWNVRQCTEFARLLKALRPEIHLILGGPEISHETDRQPLAEVADHILCGEADLAFAQTCRDLLAGITLPRLLAPALPDLPQVQMPYRLYDGQDLQHRTIYVESSRGCPFACEFCLSSLDDQVRRFPLEKFLVEMDKLLERGALQFKFVDRTFNLHIAHACAILEFFLQRMRPGLFLHFEMIPDHLPEPVRVLLTRFPPGSLQLEIGIQTFDEQVAQRIGRRQDNAKVESNFRFLREETAAHLHADLIAGLPGESLAGFAAGFDRLWSLHPHEIQLGILKRLRGAPIARHSEQFQMVYSPDPPYELLQNDRIDFPTMQRLKRMARYWDMYANSGQFRRALDLLLPDQPFARFMSFSDWLHAQTGKTHQIALPRQFELLFEYMEQTRAAGEALAADYLQAGKRSRGLPKCLQPYAKGSSAGEAGVSSQARQTRHLSH